MENTKIHSCLVFSDQGGQRRRQENRVGPGEGLDGSLQCASGRLLQRSESQDALRGVIESGNFTKNNRLGEIAAGDG